MMCFASRVHSRRRDRVGGTDNPVLAAALRRGVLRLRSLQACTPRQAEQKGLYRGYYLRCADGSNHWLGETMNQARLNFAVACDRFLSRRDGYAYDVEFSHGETVDGSTPWDNVSVVEHFI